MGPHEIETLNFIRPEHRDRARRLIGCAPMPDASLWDILCDAIDSRYVSWLPDDADVARLLRDHALGRDGCRGHAHVISSAPDLDKTDASIGDTVQLVKSLGANRSIISCLPGRIAYLRDDAAKQHALLLRPDRPIDPPSPDEAREAIARAFSDFSLQRKIGAYEAAAYDDYVTDADIDKFRREDAPYATLHWSELPRDYVVLAGNVMPFLDDASLCAFVPAFLTFLLDTTFGRHWDRDSGMVEWIEYNFWETEKGRLLTRDQRAAARMYLEYEVAHEESERSECAIGEPESPRLVVMWAKLMKACGDEVA